MANLITEKQKKLIKADYLIRLLAVALFILALLGFFLLAYVIPYYISVSKKDILVTEQFQSTLIVENKENVGESVSRIMNQTLAEMRVLELYEKNVLAPSVYFEQVIKSKNAGIQITKLSFNLVKKDQGQFIVSGLAKRREDLVAFIENLKSHAGLAKVDSPISDFAKDKDISFTLNIMSAI